MYENVFRKPGPVFLTITSGIHGTAVYTDGVLARTAPQFRLSTSDFTGRLVSGDSPGQTDSWSGQLLGLAIYRRELTAATGPTALRNLDDRGAAKIYPKMSTILPCTCLMSVPEMSSTTRQGQA